MRIGGCAIHIEGAGPETLLMLHGWPDTHALWDGTVEVLRDSFRCARFTWPGFEPGSPRTLPQLDDILALLLEVVDALCPGGKVTLVLHDWGCIFGYQFAMRHPERVERIIGVDIGDVASLVRELDGRGKLAIAAYQVWLSAAWKMGGALGDWMTRSMARWLRAPAPASTLHWQMNWPYYLTWFGGKAALPRHSVPFHPSCPMLFIHGRRKHVRFHSRSWAAALAEQPGNRVEAFDTGHWVMVQAPARFHQVVRDWLLQRSG
ncbi:alpha/beta hydrolase [Caenimonas sedimenti]|uniref:Alpha/beta hydrolase n=2 Tax=Caenimonas sedimenti TaxID=2596921 RepID=A0A562ZXZ0_9BURK|nr:alpha/beta hydrolase [Caenimonas sedimenti]